MAKVTLIIGSANITPWGQRIEGDKPFDCLDEDHLQFFKNNRRYKVGVIAPPPMRNAGKRRPVVARPEPEPAPAPVEESQPADADLSVLDGSIGSLRKALATGEWDDHLDALAAAEQAGKTRKGAVEAINERVAKLAAD